jgi:hypothetical protein
MPKKGHGEEQILRTLRQEAHHEPFLAIDACWRRQSSLSQDTP